MRQIGPYGHIGPKIKVLPDLGGFRTLPYFIPYWSLLILPRPPSQGMDSSMASSSSYSGLWLGGHMYPEKYINEHENTENQFLY